MKHMRVLNVCDVCKNTNACIKKMLLSRELKPRWMMMVCDGNGGNRTRVTDTVTKKKKVVE